MKANKNAKGNAMSLAIYLLVFLVYNLFVFFFLEPATPVFWISYGFMVLAFLVQMGSMWLAFKDLTVEAAFLGIPLASFSVYYFFAELFASLVFMIFQQIGVRIALFLQILFLAAYLVFAIVALLTRDTTVQIKEELRRNVFSLKSLAVDVEMLMQGTADPVLKEKLRRLAETVRYSDPMTHEAVAAQEARIRQELAALQLAVRGGQVKESLALCDTLTALFVERNQRLKLAK